MSDRITKCNCGTNSNCCSPKPKRQVVIDFLYLDLNTCERCCDTDKTLSDALLSVKDILNSAGIEAKINKYLIDTKEKAIEHKLLSSPTIRINGKDIDIDVKESKCQSCGDVCGDTVDCRVWSYQGIDYTSPPEALIVDAILREMYAPESVVHDSDYIMPANLERFFEALNKKRGKNYAGE